MEEPNDIEDIEDNEENEFLQDNFSDSSSSLSDSVVSVEIESETSGSGNEESVTTYNPALPLSHSYLGEMEECSGLTHQNKDTFATIPILYINDFVLVPGQTLPLHLTRTNEVALIRNAIRRLDKSFGVIHAHYTYNEESQSYTQSVSNVGCTAEIRSFRQDDDDDNHIATMNVVAIGRQRFQFVEMSRQIDGTMAAKIRVLFDTDLPDINSSVGGCCNCIIKRSMSGDAYSEFRLQNHLKRLRLSSAVSAWPHWVFNMYDCQYLRSAIFHELKKWNSELDEMAYPSNHTDFSFWVMTNLPLNDKQKLFLLQLRSSVQRLRCIYNLINQCVNLHCSQCSNLIAKRDDVFSMSASGLMAAYVNPGGVVHETITILKVKGLSYIGRKSTEHSWFPGYAWTICQCKRCHRHMGWLFTASSKDVTVKPKKFWGLTRSGLEPFVSDKFINVM